MKKSLYQLSKFGVIGASNTAIDATIYVALTRNIPFLADWYLIASFISFSVSALNGFYWNRKWTFEVATDYAHSELVKFYLVNAGALIVNQITFWFLVQNGTFDIAAKVFAGIFAGGMNFFLQKVWAFKNEEVL